jgi:hypothetical protein
MLCLHWDGFQRFRGQYEALQSFLNREIPNRILQSRQTALILNSVTDQARSDGHIELLAVGNLRFEGNRARPMEANSLARPWIYGPVRTG